MALGGGKWLTQNKILPGTYINVVSGKLASVRLSDRGVAAIPVELSWGADDELIKVEAREFTRDAKDIFGYNYTDDELLFVREIFENATTVYFYKLNKGEKAKNTMGEARYSGVRGNDITIVVTKDLDTDKFKVETILDNEVVDVQVVSKSEELKDNPFVVFDKKAVLEESAGLKMEDGSNGDVDVEAYQKFLDKISSVAVNTIGCPTNDDKVKQMFANYTKRMREEVGAFFQTLIYDTENKYDYEGIVAIPNKVNLEDKEYAAVYYYTGALAGIEVNKSLANKKYTGELDIVTPEKQGDLERALEQGLFVLHKQDDEIRVLEDINTFISHTEEKREAFSYNQTVRVFDGIGLEMALIFNNKFNGHVPNDKDGRNSLWSQFVDVNNQYSDLRAIQDFSSDELQVFEGKHIGAVGVINPIKVTHAMTHLYATIIIK